MVVNLNNKEIRNKQDTIGSICCEERRLLTDVESHSEKDDETVPEVESRDEIDGTYKNIDDGWTNAEEEVIEHRGDTRSTTVYDSEHCTGLS